MMSKIRAKWRKARPNRIGPGHVAYVILTPEGVPSFRAWIPFQAMQLVGGRRWSLSVIRSEDITGFARGAGPVDRAPVAEALDALAAGAPSHRATELLRAALGVA
jgi:hypothetical protein